MSTWDKIVDILPFPCLALLAAAVWFWDTPLKTWTPWLCVATFILTIVGIVSLLVRYF